MRSFYRVTVFWGNRELPTAAVIRKIAREFIQEMGPAFFRLMPNSMSAEDVLDNITWKLKGGGDEVTTVVIQFNGEYDG